MVARHRRALAFLFATVGGAMGTWIFASWGAGLLLGSMLALLVADE
jgi:hypothetical protein